MCEEPDHHASSHRYKWRYDINDETDMRARRWQQGEGRVVRVMIETIIVSEMSHRWEPVGPDR